MRTYPFDRVRIMEKDTAPSGPPDAPFHERIPVQMINHTPPSTPSSHGISVQSLGSGSSGNAFIVTTDDGCLLIDCGVGIRNLARDLRERGFALSDIDTICVTHEHSDHIRTLPKVVRHDTTIFATDGTAIRSAVSRDTHIRAIGDTPQRVGDITVWPLPVLHDAQEPCGFMLELPDSSRVTMLTDLGSWHDSLVEYVRASNLIILEANHDEEMLRTGPYPQYLKKRVASNVGHLSNRHCGIALGQALKTTTHEPEIWLAHLSEHNNLPFVAEDTVRTALRDNDLELTVTALPRRSASRIWTPEVNHAAAPAFVSHAAPPLQQLGLDLLL
jgi:phosphoribosyl 1,2-cyclic phosphodiesterase